ncbi:MAG: hypothetical protein V4568_03310 [Pseudomonadota bacterium]
MSRLYTPRNILSRVWKCFFAFALIFAVTTPKSQTPNPYAEDAERVAALLQWTGGAWSFITGFRTGVGFLTGLDGQSQITLADIRQIVGEALREQELTELKKEVNGYIDNFHQTQVLARDLVMSGQSMDTLMTSSWAQTYLRGRLTDLVSTGTELVNKLEPIMRLPVSVENDRLVVDALPAYTVLVPALISAMKLAGEIDPQLKRGHDEFISEKIVKAQQTLFMAAGAYVLYAYEPARGQIFFYSPVGEDRSWMLSRPLYRYYYFDPFVTTAFAGPYEPFFRYQALPVVQLALDSLEKTVNAQPAMVSATNVYIWDLYGSPSFRPKNPSLAPVAFGHITQVRQ